jgi:hypothetical protein
MSLAATFLRSGDNLGRQGFRSGCHVPADNVLKPV